MMVPPDTVHVTEVRNRLHACGLAESTKAIPHAADGVDERVHLRAVDLAANTPHIDLDDVSCGIEMKVPNVLPQHRSGNDTPFVSNQIFKVADVGISVDTAVDIARES